MNVDQVLWLAAAICFGIAAFGLNRRLHFGWLAFALIALTFVIH